MITICRNVLPALRRTVASVVAQNYPALEYWPEEAGPRDEYGRSVTEARAFWLQHPELFVTEVRIDPLVGTILGTRKAARRSGTWAST